LFNNRISDLEDKINVAKTQRIGFGDENIDLLSTKLTDRILALEAKNVTILKRVGQTIEGVRQDVRSIRKNVRGSNEYIAEKVVDLENSKTCDIKFDVLVNKVDKILDKLGL
jgi:hypothetical protein